MHQPWQEFGIKTDIIEFASGEHLANCPTAATRKISMRSDDLHPITDLKRLRHLVYPSRPSAVLVPVPRMDVPSVYA